MVAYRYQVGAESRTATGIWMRTCSFDTEIEALGVLASHAVGQAVDVRERVESLDSRPEFAAELPRFIAEIKEIFEPHELHSYFADVRRIAPLGHTAMDEQFETLRSAGAFQEDPVSSAEDILIMERIKEMLI